LAGLIEQVLFFRRATLSRCVSHRWLARTPAVSLNTQRISWGLALAQPEHRAVIVLEEIENLPCQEIAQIDAYVDVIVPITSANGF
jgi:hypothetical protein